MRARPSLEDAINVINAEYARLIQENRSLRSLSDKLADQNNELLDRVFELEQALGLRREAVNE